MPDATHTLMQQHHVTPQDGGGENCGEGKAGGTARGRINNKPSSVRHQHLHKCCKQEHFHICKSALMAIFMSDNVDFHQIGSFLRFHPGKGGTSTISFGTDDVIVLHNCCFGCDHLVRVVRNNRLLLSFCFQNVMEVIEAALRPVLEPSIGAGVCCVCYSL